MKATGMYLFFRKNGINKSVPGPLHSQTLVNARRVGSRVQPKDGLDGMKNHALIVRKNDRTLREPHQVPQRKNSANRFLGQLGVTMEDSCHGLLVVGRNLHRPKMMGRLLALLDQQKETRQIVPSLLLLFSGVAAETAAPIKMEAHFFERSRVVRPKVHAAWRSGADFTVHYVMNTLTDKK